MHLACKQFMDFMKHNFPKSFKDCSVLDVGSQDINGNNRYLFENCEYVGIDLGPGKNVDIVSHVKDFEPCYQFDTIISTNAFEHDKYFAESLKAITNRLLKPGGVFIFSAATEGTPEHGTAKEWPGHSPHTNDFYKNLNKDDIIEAIDCDSIFSLYSLSVFGNDLRFFGIKKNDQ